MRSKKTLLSLLILLLLAVSCGGNAGTDETLPTVEPTAEATATTPPEPTATTAVEATEPPTEEPTAAPTAVPLVRLGILRFTDTPVVQAGAYLLQMQEVPPPPAGQHYELWLESDDGQMLNLGALTVEENAVLLAGTTEQNLIATTGRALITLQPDGETSSAPDNVVFSGLLAPEALLHIRHVVDAFPGTPDGQGFLRGGTEEALLAQEHAGLLQESLAGDDLAEARRHAEHVVNILDGEEGEFFGDLDNDGLAQNPGDGFGVRAYLQGAQEHAQLAADAPGATAEVMLHAEHTVISSGNALAWLDEAIDNAVRVLSADSVEEAQSSADALSQLMTDMLEGRDVDGDGAVAPVEGEGGINTALQHALLMGGYEFFEGELTAEALISGAPAPTDEGATEPEAAQEVIVDMLDFVFEPVEITVPAGTTITWVNAGEFQHSATADDESWDTGLYGVGEQASITFDEPGTYPYFCILHGTPGGNGMAGTVIVEGE